MWEVNRIYDFIFKDLRLLFCYGLKTVIEINFKTKFVGNQFNIATDKKILDRLKLNSFPFTY